MAHKTPDEPNIPNEVEYVFVWFWRLSSQRRGGFSGPDALGWDTILSWSTLTGLEVRPGEVEMLVAMDSAYRDEVSREQQARRDENATNQRHR